MYQQTIIARYREGRQEKALVMVLDCYVDGLDPETAIKAAAEEFTGTKRGQAVMERLSGRLTYGNFLENVPDWICKKHGFTLSDAFDTHIVVDRDERLVTD